VFVVESVIERFEIASEYENARDRPLAADQATGIFEIERRKSRIKDGNVDDVAARGEPQLAQIAGNRETAMGQDAHGVADD
jgi:hypothetical protein